MFRSLKDIRFTQVRELYHLNVLQIIGEFSNEKITPFTSWTISTKCLGD